jgi:hypothetical protein
LVVDVLPVLLGESAGGHHVFLAGVQYLGGLVQSVALAPGFPRHLQYELDLHREYIVRFLRLREMLGPKGQRQWVK